MDEDGLVTANAPGEVLISAAAQNGVSDSVRLTVYRPLESLDITGTDGELMTCGGYDTVLLTAVATPANASYPGVSWTSSDDTVASVSKDGLVTAHSAGTVTITAVSSGPESVEASVELRILAVTMQPRAVCLLPNQSVRLPKPENADTVRFISHTPETQLRVMEDGGITALDTGSYTVLMRTGPENCIGIVVTVQNLSTLQLPAALTSIEAEAFADDTAIERIVLGKKMAIIGAGAFANASALRQIVLPDTEINIAEDAFTNVYPTILCTENSSAQSYAIAHGLPCAFPAEQPQ